MFTVPTSTVTSVMANVGTIFSDPGLLAVVVAAVAIPLAFWVIRAVIGLFPKSRAKHY